MCVGNTTHWSDMNRIVRKNANREEELEDLLANTASSGDCKVWVRCFNSDGYPRMANNVKVHRRVYELLTGLDLTGLVVRHTCDNPKCISPDHLTHGTATDNMKDRDDRDRTYRVITKEIVRRTKELLSTGILSRKEIANLVQIDVRRVSDISNNLYSEEAKFLGRGSRRF